MCNRYIYIYVCVFYCKFMYILILYLKSYICYTMQIELFLYRKKYMGIVAICHYSFANCGNRIYVL